MVCGEVKIDCGMLGGENGGEIELAWSSGRHLKRDGGRHVTARDSKAESNGVGSLWTTNWAITPISAPYMLNPLRPSLQPSHTLLLTPQSLNSSTTPFPIPTDSVPPYPSSMTRTISTLSS